jgi:hypothetical protein
VFTDPVVISGPVTNDERAQRSSIGVFLFVPPGVNEGLIGEVGLRLVQEEDVPANAALVSGRWHRARQEHELLKLEGLQRFFAYVERLMSERRLSRIAHLVEKRGGGEGRRSACSAGSEVRAGGRLVGAAVIAIGTDRSRWALPRHAVTLPDCARP